MDMSTLAMSIVTATMSVMGIPINDLETSQEIYCGAQNVYHESRGEPDLGMVAVAQVVSNRIKSPRFPDTVCEVVYQHKQFSWVNDGLPNQPLLSDPAERESFIKSAWVHIIATEPPDITYGATHYHRYDVEPWWSYQMTVVAIIGKHIFYTDK